ncbi:MAG: hypothetical protein HZA17_03560 [Nitrospirae bacterium]|nr:hypothetical protein [Nitrospirota bacterium]
MEQIPSIIMKCQRCGKTFPLDASYCEDCSVMLEPVEVENTGNAPGEESSTTDIRQPASDEEIDNIRIDNLKADIEDKFIYTLFFEKERLNRRLQEKERSFLEMQEKNKDPVAAEFILSADKKEKEIDGIIRKIARIEATLDEMKKTVSSEITDLEGRVSGMQRPGTLWFFSRNRRYARMLFSELKVKKIFLDILEGNRSANYFRTRRLGKISLLICLCITLTFIITWQVFNLSSGGRAGGSALSPISGERTPEIGSVKREDVIALLEDIRKANLGKDIGLWESRYTRRYLALPGKRATTLEQWKDFDYRSLTYSIDSIKIQPGSATTLVTWNIELFSKKKNEAKIISQRLFADLVVEDGKLKISSVTKQ